MTKANKVPNNSDEAITFPSLDAKTQGCKLDRTSCTRATANQMRFMLHAGAHCLM